MTFVLQSESTTKSFSQEIKLCLFLILLKKNRLKNEMRNKFWFDFENKMFLKRMMNWWEITYDKLMCNVYKII